MCQSAANPFGELLLLDDQTDNQVSRLRKIVEMSRMQVYTCSGQQSDRQFFVCLRRGYSQNRGPATFAR